MIKYVDKNGLIYYTSKIKGITNGLQNQIDDIKSIGRFLSNWSCKTGKPTSEPPGLSPGDAFTYRSGDYYLVSEIAASGGTNYRPNGSTYIVGSTSSTVETDEVAVGDMYIYDSQNWLLLYNTRKTVSFSNLSGSPYDNTNLSSALNAKQDELTEGAGIDISNDTISNSGVRSVSTGSTNGTISVNTGGTSAEVAVAGLGSAAYTSSTDYATAAQGGLADTAVQPAALADYVPVTRTVNGEALSSNITLDYTDVGAASAAQGALADTAVQPAALNNYVPTSRTVNGKALSANITLTYSDVGAGQPTIFRDYD